MKTQKETSKAEKLTCAACDYPFARVQIGKGVVITSRHDGHIHTNVLTLEQLRKIIAQVE
jgi:hypothetical protein